jgi:plasmid stability protein
MDMGQITLTHVEDEILQAVRARAEATGRSVEEIAGEALKRGLRTDMASLTKETPFDLARDLRPTAEEVRRRVEAADRIRAMTQGPLDSDSTALIRADRDRR